MVLRIVYHRVVHGTKVLYYPPAGPNRVPMYRDLVILLSTRWMFRRTILHFHAGGISELYPQLSRPIQWLFRRALFGADAAVRISHGSPPDAIALEAKREFVVPYGIEDAPVRFENRRSVHRSLANQIECSQSVSFRCGLRGRAAADFLHGNLARIKGADGSD